MCLFMCVLVYGNYVCMRMRITEDVPLVDLCTLYLHTCQVRITVGDSGLCCSVCVTSLGRSLTPLCVDSNVKDF